MKLIRLTLVKGDIDIIVNTAHIVFIEISEDGWSVVQTTTAYYIVKQSFNEIMLLGDRL